jgi:hypothetical protein
MIEFGTTALPKKDPVFQPFDVKQEHLFELRGARGRVPTAVGIIDTSIKFGPSVVKQMSSKWSRVVDSSHDTLVRLVDQTDQFSYST